MTHILPGSRLPLFELRSMIVSIGSKTTTMRQQRTIASSPGSATGVKPQHKQHPPKRHNSISVGTSSSASSPVGTIDPLVRAINTFMFGILIHFGTLWIFGIYNSQNHDKNLNANDAGIYRDNEIHQDASSSISSSSWFSWILAVLLLHEYWVYLQHCNVLANPYCQRLDRQYGIALLKSNQHWAIAGTLAESNHRIKIVLFLTQLNSL